MRRSALPLQIVVLNCLLLLCLLSGCSTPDVNVAPAPTPVPPYTLAGGGACVRLGSHAQSPYTNVRVSHDSYLAHSEPMLAEDPANPLHLVGGSKFFTDPAHYRFQIGYYASFDGGCTWTDGGVLPGFGKNMLTSDPTFAFGSHNRVYAAYLYTVAANGRGQSGIAVSTSTDGGKTFVAPVTVFVARVDKVFSDKPWMAVDQTRGPHSGNIYVAWSYDHVGSCSNACGQELAFSRSTDGGKSFSPVQLIEGHAAFCANPVAGKPTHSPLCDAVLGATPVVEPNGTIAIATMYLHLTGRGNIPNRLMLVTSRDGGITWPPPVLITTIHEIPGIFRPERYRNVSLPAFASDPKTGQLYIAWSDERNGDADILLSTSKNGGQSWSAPLRVNDDPLRDGANQFQPQLAVAPDGVVSVSFFDTRVDPQHRLIDVYLAQSLDRGASFLKNVRVTTQSWNPAVNAPVDESGAQFIGDYQGLSADDHFAHPFWNDTRTGRQEIFTAAVPSAQPR